MKVTLFVFRVTSFLIAWTITHMMLVKFGHWVTLGILLVIPPVVFITEFLFDGWVNALPPQPPDYDKIADFET